MGIYSDMYRNRTFLKLLAESCFNESYEGIEQEDVSPEEIESLKEYFNESLSSSDELDLIRETNNLLTIDSVLENLSYIEEASADEISRDALKSILKTCLGSIMSVSYIKTYCTEVAKIIKKNGINKQARKEIGALRDKLDTQIYESIASSNDAKDSVPVSIEYRRAIGLFINVALYNTICYNILTLVLGPIGGMITVCILGPLNEESAKNIAIKGKFDKEFTIVFNICEGSSYVLQYGPYVGFIKMTLSRLKCVAMHVTTTVLQKIVMSDKIMKVLKLDPNKPEDKNKASIVAKLCGCAIHCFWNYGATTNAKWMRKLMGRNE